jgi:thioredoxin reductase (NADPH)
MSMKRRSRQKQLAAEVLIVGGGLAGLSAAIYLGRAQRDTLVVDLGKSMARWEPDVQNFIGFPKGVPGEELLQRGWRQAERYGVRFEQDEILTGKKQGGSFRLTGKRGDYRGQRLLLSTGIFHIPPELPHVSPCLGHSMFFCKDCDGYRVQNKAIAVYGWNNEAVEYALGMLLYSPCVWIVTDGREPHWSRQHQRWLEEYEVPVYGGTIHDVRCRGHQIRGLLFDDQTEVKVEALFTTRGDIYLNKLAKTLHAKVDSEGQIIVGQTMATSVPGLYAAGCVTPSNCQMIIAAGQGAIAAQAINRDLFEESLRTHSLRQYRQHQLRSRQTMPVRRRSPLRCNTRGAPAKRISPSGRRGALPRAG